VDSVNLASGANNITVSARDKYGRSNTQTIAVTMLPEPSFTWDANGNMTSDGEWALTWTAENQLATITKSGSKKLEFVYDGVGRRRAKKVYTWANDDWTLSSHIKFVYSGWNLIAELDGMASDAVLRRYVWGLDLSGTLQNAGGVGGLLAVVEADNSVYCPCYDLNGNVTSYVSAAGATVAAYDYTPFGDLISKTGSKADDFAFGFSTKYRDKETDLLYYGYRYYAPYYARWINRDPIGEFNKQDQFNPLYLFALNSPINKIDKLGLDILDWFGFEIGKECCGGKILSRGQKCCVRTPYNTDTQCCENNSVVSKVQIWTGNVSLANTFPADNGWGNLWGLLVHVEVYGSDPSTGNTPGVGKTTWPEWIFPLSIPFIPVPGQSVEDTQRNPAINSIKSKMVCPEEKKRLLSEGMTWLPYMDIPPFNCWGYSWGGLWGM
jgi:RHS repeat-associated protein